MRNSNSKIIKFNSFLIKKERSIFFTFIFVVLFLIFSYTFLIFSSVSLAYGIKDDKSVLTKINLENSLLESEFSVKKENASILVNTSGQLVLVDDIEYIDSSFEKLVFNK
jgi:hypothetical protein